MGKGPSTKTSSNQSFTSRYDFLNVPINAQLQSVLDMANEPVGADPSITHRYASMEDEVRRSNADPFGAGTSADVRQKSQLSRILGIQKERDKAMREDHYRAKDTEFARKSAAAAFTMPQAVQTGGTSTGNQTTSQNQGWGGAVPGIAGGILGVL